MNDAILLQRGEGALVFVAGLAVYINLNAGLPWWLACLVFFAPDISMVAYLLGPRIGAIGYNLVHVYACGVALLAIGFTLESMTCAGIGALFLAHAGFDRMLGYGLKLPDGFAVTHLGVIGNPGSR